MPYPGIKELHGTWRGYYQFEVSRSRGIRLIYTVDDESRVVTIEHFGNHPEWNHSRDRQGL